MSQSTSVLVTGASSQIGKFLLPRLLAEGCIVHALSRRPVDGRDGVIWHRADIERLELPDIEVDCVVHLAPLPLLPELLPRIAKTSATLRRIIAFGSTSRFTKQHSADAAEREFARQLAAAEQAIAQFGARNGVPWTVFRPTLIYGCGLDKNVAVIARFIRRFGFFPLVGGTGGLRQPVHADDLAAACVRVMTDPATFNRAYDLSGGEVLSYRTMVERIFLAEGRTPRFVSIPLPLFRIAMELASRLPRYRHLSGEMASRMSTDLSFEHAEASRDFGYAPRPFAPPPIAAV